MKIVKLILNFSKVLEPIYKKAIKEFGNDILFVDPVAYNVLGQQLTNYSALKARKNIKQSELEAFWKIFDKIREEEDTIFKRRTQI